MLLQVSRYALLFSGLFVSVAMSLMPMVTNCQAGVTDAAEEAAAPDIQPLMCELGKLVLADDFSNGKMAQAWFRISGKFAVIDDSLKATEIGDDQHHTELSTGATGDLDGPNLVIQYSFSLDGANRLGVGLENPQGHVARALAEPTGFNLSRWTGNKSEVVVELPAKTWHTVLWEIYGDEMVAQLDGKYTLHVADKKLADQRSRLVLISWGDSAWFDKIRVWKASKLRADWPKTRETLPQE